jgi:hypothetical protein
VEESNITGFFEVVQGIFEVLVGLLLSVLHDPWHPIIKVSQEDYFGAINHEEGHVAHGPIGGHP